MTYTTKTQRAIKTYGRDVCIEAYRMHKQDGEGARTIGFYLGLKTNQADAAINAGQEIVEGMALLVRYGTAEDGAAETVVSGFAVIAAFKAEGPVGCYSKSPRQVRWDTAYAHVKAIAGNKTITNYAVIN